MHPFKVCTTPTAFNALSDTRTTLIRRPFFRRQRAVTTRVCAKYLGCKVRDVDFLSIASYVRRAGQDKDFSTASSSTPYLTLAANGADVVEVISLILCPELIGLVGASAEWAGRAANMEEGWRREHRVVGARSTSTAR